MPFNRRCGILRLAAFYITIALPACFGAVTAWAESFPSRPIRIVVPTQPGAAQDIIARLLQPYLEKSFGQPVIIENRSGASTMIGTDAVAKAAPDGYSLLIVPTTFTVNAALNAKLAFDLERDFAPITVLVKNPLIFAVNAKVPARTLPEFVALARAEPAKLNYGTSGASTQAHLLLEMWSARAGVKMQHVPYRGGAPMVTDIIGGNVQAGIDALPNSLPHIRSGAMRALALTGPARSAVLPDVATIGETVPGYEVSGWTGVGVPSGTPADIVAVLNREINAGLRDPNIIARLADVGGRPIVMSTEEFGKIWMSETEKWAPVVKFAGVKAK
jgi:tripartite-type tricarboxylate transporter receptor subunit TctC